MYGNTAYIVMLFIRQPSAFHVEEDERFVPVEHLEGQASGIGVAIVADSGHHVAYTQAPAKIAPLVGVVMSQFGNALTYALAENHGPFG